MVFIALVSLITGLAAELSASPLFTAMLAGAIMSNVRGPMLRDFERFMLQAEHPVGIMFALLAGVFLDPAIGRWGGILVIGLLAGRLVLKPLIMQRSLRPLRDELPTHSPMWASAIRQSPMAVVLALGLILSEASLFHEKLLAVIVFTGLFGELLPLVATLLGGRFQARRNGAPRLESREVPT